MQFIAVGYICREDQGQVEFAALEQFENPDLHMDSVQTMKLYNRVKHVIASLDCPKKFTLKDLIKPDPDRTEIFLSAMLNFCIHKYDLYLLLYVVLYYLQMKTTSVTTSSLVEKVFMGLSPSLVRSINQVISTHFQAFYCSGV